MGKNIKIVPSNEISRTSDRIPFINFINNAGDTPIDIKVLTTGEVQFSSSTQSNILSINIGNTAISATTLNVKDYFLVGSPGTQVINSTGNWVGPTTNIAGAQGAQGAQGDQGSTVNPTNPVTTLTLTAAQNIVYSSFGTKFFSTYNLNGTGTEIYDSCRRRWLCRNSLGKSVASFKCWTFKQNIKMDRWRCRWTN